MVHWYCRSSSNLASPILNNIDRYSPSFSENRNPKIYTFHTSVQFEEFISVIEGKQVRLIIPASMVYF